MRSLPFINNRPRSLTFWHIGLGERRGKSQFELRLESSSSDIVNATDFHDDLLWKAKGDTSDDWTKTTVTIGATGQFAVI